MYPQIDHLLFPQSRIKQLNRTIFSTFLYLREHHLYFPWLSWLSFSRVLAWISCDQEELADYYLPFSLEVLVFSDFFPLDLVYFLASLILEFKALSWRLYLLSQFLLERFVMELTQLVAQVISFLIQFSPNALVSLSVFLQDFFEINFYFLAYSCFAETPSLSPSLKVHFIVEEDLDSY